MIMKEITEVYASVVNHLKIRVCMHVYFCKSKCYQGIKLLTKGSFMRENSNAYYL